MRKRTFLFFILFLLPILTFAQIMSETGGGSVSDLDFTQEEQDTLEKYDFPGSFKRLEKLDTGRRDIMARFLKKKIAYFRFLNVGDYRAPRYESLDDIGRSLPALMALWPGRPGAYRIGYTNVMHSLQSFYIMDLEKTPDWRTRSFLIQNNPGLFSDGYESIYATLLTNALDIGLSPDADRFRDYEKIKFYECFVTTMCRNFTTTNTVALLVVRLGDIRRQIDAIDAGDAQCALLPEHVRRGLRELGGAPKEIVEFPQGDSYETPQDYRAMLVAHDERILRYIGPNGLFQCLLGDLPYETKIVRLRTFAEQARLTPSQTEKHLAPVAAYFKRRHDEELDEARKEAERERELELRRNPPYTERPHDSGDLGCGYPGRIEPYAATPELQRQMDRFGLSAGWFIRDPYLRVDATMPAADCPDRLPFLLFSPKPSPKPLPLVLYFGGTGESGTNLIKHFNQSAVFGKLCSDEFQKRHPCYLLAPMTPLYHGTVFGAVSRYTPSDLAELVCDTMYAVVREARRPPVDLNRLYMTGLSSGGYSTFATCFAYPGRFAACIPVASVTSRRIVPERNAGRYWALYNSGDAYGGRMKTALEEMKTVVEQHGGEMRIGAYSDKGHDAWSKAWQEDSVWDWLFSKTTEAPARVPGGGSAPGQPSPSAVCTASVPGRDGFGPERCVDGLDGTWYESASPMTSGDWLTVEFPSPRSGRFTICTGRSDGGGRLSRGRVEVSSTGGSWTRVANVSGKTGVAAFSVSREIRFVRLLPEPYAPEPLVVREVGYE